MEPMYLYHYSEVGFSTLKTKNRQNNRQFSSTATPKEVGFDSHLWDYNDQISFFIDPIPSDIIAQIYQDHFIWYSGNVLVEHRVLMSSLGEMNFDIAESLPRNKLRAQWTHYKTMSEEEYYDAFFRFKKKSGEMGTTIPELKRAVLPYLGKMRSIYKKYPSTVYYELKSEQYAAFIPHVMIYPFSGEIPVDDLKIVVIS